MADASLIAPELIAAYRATDYHVHAEPESTITLRIGRRSAALDALHRARKVSGSAFITACNPFSRKLSDAENRARQASLGAVLDAPGLARLPAAGIDPDGKWPAEPGYLVLGVSRAEALALARRFQQNALVFCDATAIPALQLCR